MDALIALFTDPLTLIVLGLFAGFALFETLRPGRRFPAVRGWRLKGALFFLAVIVGTSFLPLVYDDWFAAHRLIDATALGNVGGAVVGFVVFQLVLYAWHRALHTNRFLWRWFHQMHHSAERVDLFGAFYFHPLDVIGFAVVGSVSLVWILGLTAPAAVTASMLGTLCTIFQHTNIKTPRWLGYLVHRPESHSVHHERPDQGAPRAYHTSNYGDIPLWDMVFGTFRNPATFEGEAGFYDGASERVFEMLIGRDVSTPPARRGTGEQEPAPARPDSSATAA